MAGDVAGKNKSNRDIQLEYSYDRLMEIKIIQAYGLLVPDKIWVKDSTEQPTEKDRERYANSRDICKGIS